MCLLLFPFSIALVHSSVLPQTRGPCGLQVGPGFLGRFGLGPIKWRREMWGGMTFSTSGCEMSSEHPQPSRRESNHQNIGSKSNLGIRTIRSCWDLRSLIKDSLSRHNETQPEQPPRAQHFPVAALGHVSGHDSHPTRRRSLLSRAAIGAESCGTIPQKMDGSSRGFRTQFRAELFILSKERNL